MQEVNFEIKYCKKCLIPNSRPGVKIGHDGISNVWNEYFSEKKKIDWGQ